MRGIATILHREFLGYFRAPIAYVFLVVFVLLGIGLPWFVDNVFESDEASLQHFFRWLPWINVLFVPAVGMRLWSEEKNSGTWELLLTLPFSTAQAVVGKFLAGWLFVGVGLALTFPLPATIAYLGEPDWGPIAGGYAVSFLMAGAVLGICSLMSSLTQNQVVAFILGVLACLVLNLTGWSVFNSLLRDLPVALADALANFSFTTHFETARQGLLRFGDVAFFLVVIAGALLANVIVLQREAAGAVLARKAAALALVAVGVALANDLAGRAPLQADLTRERLFTLSAPTRALLTRIEHPLEVELYFSASRRGIPIGLKVFAQRVEQLLRQYERAAPGRLIVRVLDPTPGSREEEEARRLGLEARPLGPDERLYFGLALFHGGNRRIVPLIDFRRERLLEHDLSRLIAAVQNHHRPKLAVASSLEVFGRRGVPEDQRKIEDGTAEWQFIRELRLAWDVVEVHPSFETLPADAEALLVIHPTGFDPRLLHAIDQFILSGRPAVLLVDPYNYFEHERDATDGPVIGETYHKASDWPALFAAWGVRFSAREIVADLLQPTRVPVQENQPPAALPVWISLTHFDDAQPITAGFDRVTLAHAGHLAPLPGSPARFTPLLRTSTRSAVLATDEVDRMNPFLMTEMIRPDGNVYTLAASIEGPLATAFPAGKPSAPAGGPASAEKDPWALGLKAAADTARVIVVADTDFIKDQLAYESVSRSGSIALAKPRNHNVALLQNCLEHVRGARDLPVPAKGQALRPFVRIAELRHAAEENFRQEVNALNARLAQLDATLAELNRQAAQGGGALVSEKALTAIRQAQKEQAGLRTRRAEIRQQLEQMIAGLQQRLALLNLGLVPAAIALGGVAFWIWRTRRRSFA